MLWLWEETKINWEYGKKLNSITTNQKRYDSPCFLGEKFVQYIKPHNIQLTSAIFKQWEHFREVLSMLFCSTNKNRFNSLCNFGGKIMQDSKTHKNHLLTHLDNQTNLPWEDEANSKSLFLSFFVFRFTFSFFFFDSI